jgi:hypothetical protein
MKNLKILLLLISFLSVSEASYYSGKTDHCIEDYYFKKGTFYYLKSRTGNWNTNTANGSGNQIIKNYIYDSVNDTCKPDINKYYGMTEEQFNFLLGLCGLIFGAVFLFFTVDAFVKVGGKK